MGDSLKAAIVSSMESNWWVGFKGECIFVSNWFDLGRGLVVDCAPRCGIGGGVGFCCGTREELVLPWWLFLVNLGLMGLGLEACVRIGFYMRGKAQWLVVTALKCSVTRCQAGGLSIGRGAEIRRLGLGDGGAWRV